MKVWFGTDTGDRTDRNLAILRERAELDRWKKHQVALSPEEADILLFFRVGPIYQQALMRNALFRDCFPRAYVYDEMDCPLAMLPGLYPSVLRRNYDPRRFRSFPFWRQYNPWIEAFAGRYREREIEVSFVGSATSPVRKRLFSHAKLAATPGLYLENTSGQNDWLASDAQKKEFFLRYAEIMARSRFVLCPAGAGPGTFRLFETMQMGRAPILIADDYVLPDGPRWEGFLLQLRESDLDTLPDLVRARRSEAEELGRLAQIAWEEHFSRENYFHYLCETLEDLHRCRTKLKELSKLNDRVAVEFWSRVGCRKAHGVTRRMLRAAALHVLTALDKRPLLAVEPPKGGRVRSGGLAALKDSSDGLDAREITDERGGG
ncbi:MAG: exostosin family protein [Candidatus Methylacidiphilaceae bacterium]